MRKKVLIVVGILFLGGVNLYLNTTEEFSIKDIVLEDIESMAQNEGTTASNMHIYFNPTTLCYVCTGGGRGCAVSDQCCISWGNCP